MLISIYGDSISTFEGMNPPGYRVFYDLNKCIYNCLSGPEDTWWGRVLAEFGWELLINAAFSGGRVTGREFPSACSPERLSALHNERYPDLIMVYLGFNDYGYGLPLRSGKPEPDTDFFYDAYRFMLRELKSRYPGSKIVCGTLMQPFIAMRPDVSEAIRTNRYGVPLTMFNQVIREAVREEGALLCDLEATGLMCDTLDSSHGSFKGHMSMAEGWISCLKQLGL
ncbi:MAG: SGNH/GDSL hydrolase family protein [Ruminococcus sp.]|nr:SGNH/GDSL hydrolase family protein [Ruminococcus sp.]